MINFEKLTRDEQEDLMERHKLSEWERSTIRRGPYPFGTSDKNGEPVFSDPWYHVAVGELLERERALTEAGPKGKDEC